jgi:hypothetical protein
LSIGRRKDVPGCSGTVLAFRHHRQSFAGI